jgi:very-short-patch-repair endonuclease
MYQVKKMPSRTILEYNPKLRDRARELRSNMTDAEVKLWQNLRMRQVAGVKFMRQRPIGNYIVDFYSPETGLVIEVDGGQHYEKESEEYDKIRDAFLQDQGLTVLRFTNMDVLQNIEGHCCPR